jgi:hypothetical protein
VLLRQRGNESPIIERSKKIIVPLRFPSYCYVNEARLNKKREKKIQLLNISPFANFNLHFYHYLIMGNDLGIALA